MKKSSILISILCLLFQFSYSQPTTETVEAGAYYFNPDPIEIEVVSTVTWINVGGLHDVNGVINSVTDEPVNNPESFSSTPTNIVGTIIYTHEFTIPGVYNYDCSVGWANS